MDKKRNHFWKNPCEAIFTIVIILLAIGCINVFSASQVAAEDMFGNSKHYLYRYALFAASGIFAMWLLSLVNYRIWLKKTDLFAAGVIFLLMYVSYKGVVIKGAQRWLEIGSFSFQPSELAKMAVIFLCASSLGRHIDRQRRGNLLSASFFWSVAMGFLVYLQPDMGTAAIIVGLALGLYFICGLPHRQYLMLLCGIPLAVFIFTTRAAYRAERVRAWLDPWAYADRTGYQAVQSMLAIGSGGWLGMGMGRGSSKFYYLPEAHTDFSFAVFCQEWGFIGAVLVIVLFMALSYMLWRAAALAPDGAGYIIITGTNLLLTGQAVANIAMVCGMLPVIGVPLPFISYGGTSLLISMGMLGVALNVARQGQLKKDLPPVYSGLDKKRHLRLVKG